MSDTPLHRRYHEHAECSVCDACYAEIERLTAENERQAAAIAQLQSSDNAALLRTAAKYEAECKRWREALHQAQNLIAAGRDANFNEVGECEDDDWPARIDKWLNQALAQEPPAAGCAHRWIDARNVVVESGELCVKCHAVRAPREPIT